MKNLKERRSLYKKVRVGWYIVASEPFVVPDEGGQWALVLGGESS